MNLEPLSKTNFALALGALTIAALLLFARLGHYAIWDDEAMIALAAKGVLRTGDTSVQPDDHNIVAYRGGILVRDLRDRSTPPLATYLTAGSFLLFGKNALAARLPFALFGLGTVGLLLWWLRRARGDGLTLALFAMAILGNVSLFLYCRQCRYYAPAVFFSVAVSFYYLRWNGSSRALVAPALMSALLFAANYLNYLVLYVCIAADYFIWRRKEQPLHPRQWAVLLAPQLVLNAALASVWNPLKTQFGQYGARNDLADRLTLFFWNWRDLDACEFLVGTLVLAAPVLGFATKNKWLLRGSLALLLYVAAITCVSPQIVRETTVADVRYLVPVIPLCITLAVLTIRALATVFGKISQEVKVAFSLGVALLAFCTNLLHGGPLLARGFHSTIAQYIGELTSPPSDPFTPAAAWINANVRDGESVWVEPDYMAYPLMFHAPKATYAWQLSPPVAPQFLHLPPIHFQGRVPPDYIISFGPVVQQVAQMLQGWRGARYEHAATIDHFWKDMHRPELFWRTFTPITGYNKEREAIYVLKRIELPASSSR